MKTAVLEKSSFRGMQVLFSCKLYYVPYHFYGRAFSCTCEKPIHHLNIHGGWWAFIWPFGHKSHVIHYIGKRFVEISINYAGCNFSSWNTIHWFGRGKLHQKFVTDKMKALEAIQIWLIKTSHRCPLSPTTHLRNK